MSDIDLSNLDRLLQQLVFQLEQAFYAKECARQQLQLCTADIAQKRSEISQLREDISKNDEAVASLVKHKNTHKENFHFWKTNYVLLNKHEEYLQKELQNCQETTEKDKEMYQDYINQYEKTFKQDQAKYTETAEMQEYYQKEKELQEIQNRVLKLSKLLKQKEAEVMHLQEPGPFPSLSKWASEIASLRKNTKETLKHAGVIREHCVELEQTAEELETQINCAKQELERIAEQQHLSEQIEEKTAENLPLSGKEFAESLFKEHVGQPFLLNDKYQKYKLLQLPSISQKFVQSTPPLKPLPPYRQTGAEEKEDPAGPSTVTSIYFSQVENEKQKCNDTVEANHAKISPFSSTTNLQKQMPFRLMVYQKQANNKQWAEAETMETENEEIYTRMETENKSKYSASASQSSKKECAITSTAPNATPREEAAESLTTILEPKTPDYDGVKTYSEALHSDCEELVSKSPAFSFLMNLSEKSPSSNFFDCSAFGGENSDEAEEGYSARNLHTISPQKDIGDLFGKMENESSFAFSFPSCSPAQAFEDGKDDFSFPFAFGSSQPASHKGFQSSAQSRKTFSFF